MQFQHPHAITPNSIPAIGTCEGLCRIINIGIITSFRYGNRCRFYPTFELLIPDCTPRINMLIPYKFSVSCLANYSVHRVAVNRMNIDRVFHNTITPYSIRARFDGFDGIYQVIQSNLLGSIGIYLTSPFVVFIVDIIVCVRKRISWFICICLVFTNMNYSFIFKGRTPIETEIE